MVYHVNKSTVPAGGSTNVVVTFNNNGSATLEFPAYYWYGSSLQLNAPNLSPGWTKSFTVSVSASEYSAGQTFTRKAKATGIYSGNYYSREIDVAFSVREPETYHVEITEVW